MIAQGPFGQSTMHWLRCWKVVEDDKWSGYQDRSRVMIFLCFVPGSSPVFRGHFSFWMISGRPYIKFKLHLW